VAIKDLFDMTGIPTTAGCKAVADRARPAERDAACLAGIRAGEAAGNLHILGKTNLHELAFGITGINPWFGTPANPRDERLVPGGSSSGSAVLVARGETDLALGTDSGGSIRIPAACCGIAGLKTTQGRISTEGVWPLAPSLDTVGPLARDVAGLVWGMQLLEPGFTMASSAEHLVAGRVRVPAEPEIDASVDGALARAGLEVVEVELPGWDRALRVANLVIGTEAFDTVGHLLALREGLGEDVAARLERGAAVSSKDRASLKAHTMAWRREIAGAFGRVQLLAMPTLSGPPPTLENAAKMFELRQTHPANLAGTPALALPVPSPGGLPASLQLIGPVGSEEVLLAAAMRIEAAVAAGA
jgi:amidase